MEVIDRFVTTAHGRLHYRQAGAGPALVLLHSNGASARQFDPIIAGLAGAHTVYALDLPGHGDSDPLGRHHTIEEYGDAVSGFIDAVGAGRCPVAGSSVGGLIALHLARATPARIAAVGLIETPIRDDAFWGAQWPRLEKAFTATQQSFDEVRPRFRDITPALHERWNIDRAKAGAKTMMDVMWAGRAFDAAGALDALAAADLPVWVAIGEAGPIADLIETYRLRLPRAAHNVFPGCGHFPMIDAPERFAAALRDFLAGVGAR
jgi:pimeloyl-ACP methyl ester carboxylesterase